MNTEAVLSRGLKSTARLVALTGIQSFKLHDCRQRPCRVA